MHMIGADWMEKQGRKVDSLLHQIWGAKVGDPILWPYYCNKGEPGGELYDSSSECRLFYRKGGRIRPLLLVIPARSPLLLGIQETLPSEYSRLRLPLLMMEGLNGYERIGETIPFLIFIRNWWINRGATIQSNRRIDILDRTPIVSSEERPPPIDIFITCSPSLGGSSIIFSIPISHYLLIGGKGGIMIDPTIN